MTLQRSMILLMFRMPTAIPTVGKASRDARDQSVQLNQINVMTQHVSQSILIKSALCYRRCATNGPNCFAVRRQCDHRLYHLPVQKEVSELIDYISRL